jgi:hypothetical protein
MANPQIFRISLQIANLQSSTKFEKLCICGLAEVLSPQITKRLGPQIANPLSATNPQI